MTTLRSPSIDLSISTILQEYPEMGWLAGSIHGTPEGKVDASAPTISQRIFGEKQIEFDRTAVGILVLDWVLAADYESFTECQWQQVEQGRMPLEEVLSPKSFDELRKYTQRILPDETSRRAMVTFMVINDLGKVDAVVDELKARAVAEETAGSRNPFDDVDHDKLLLLGLRRHPEIFPSFCALPIEYRKCILEGLAAEFNIGQFIQAENLPSNLQRVLQMGEFASDFYMLHALCDIAGAAGHVVQNGSRIMTESTWANFREAVSGLEKLSQGKSPTDVYHDYLAQRANAMGFSIETSEDLAVARLGCMLRAFRRKEADEIRGALRDLDTTTRSILTTELSRWGSDECPGILLYYAPALLVNARDNAGGEPEHRLHGLEQGLTMLARLYQKGRTLAAQSVKPEQTVFTLLVSDVAKQATKPLGLSQLDLEVKRVGDNAEAIGVTRPGIDLGRFGDLQSLGDIPGQRIAVVAIGGGSDCVQAGVFSQLLQQVGKTCPAVISVRSEKTMSQGTDGRQGVSRSLESPGEIVSDTKGRPMAFQVLPESTGSGRFLENLPARLDPVYLVIDTPDIPLEDKLNRLLRHLGGVDTVLALDTGGDSLYRMNAEQGQATPDQDAKVLKALVRVQVDYRKTCIVACGVDSPPDAEAVLLEAGAKYYAPQTHEIQTIFSIYHEERMDGSAANEGLYGKTSFAWQMALKMALKKADGVECLPLPERVVLDAKNPWDPYVHVRPEMQGFFVGDLRAHLQAIGAGRSVSISDADEGLSQKSDLR
ncbi:MAG TPA: hypothetical protein VGZ00_08035 [Candidatus Baltobacteraceae bacterium]|nr:hypothetical protein [Candidatus Baltobacteraceae bacterium]